MKNESGETLERSKASHPPKHSHNALSLQELTRLKQVSDVRQRHKVTETSRKRWRKTKAGTKKKSCDEKPGRMGLSGLKKEKKKRCSKSVSKSVSCVSISPASEGFLL